MIRAKGGELVQVTVLDKARHSGAKTVCRCLFCRQDWASVEEMLIAHDEKVMARQQEKHVWFWWSNDTCDPQLLNTRVAEITARMGIVPETIPPEALKTIRDQIPKVLGALSDEL